MNVSELVKAIREQLGISQRELARELGIAFSTVNRWENGLFEPTVMARKILKMYCESHNIERKLIDAIDTV
jgi:Predicted transcriptional regulator